MQGYAPQANARLIAIKFAGHGACQVVAGARSVVLNPALASGAPWTVLMLSNTRPNPSTNR